MPFEPLRATSDLKPLLLLNGTLFAVKFHVLVLLAALKLTLMDVLTVALAKFALKVAEFKVPVLPL